MLTLARSNLICISFSMPYNSIRKLYVGFGYHSNSQGKSKNARKYNVFSRRWYDLIAFIEVVNAFNLSVLDLLRH